MPFFLLFFSCFLLVITFCSQKEDLPSVPDKFVNFSNLSHGQKNTFESFVSCVPFLGIDAYIFYDGEEVVGSYVIKGMFFWDYPLTETQTSRWVKMD